MSRNTVGGDGKSGMHHTEVISRQRFFLHLLIVGVRQQQFHLLVCRHLCIQSVAIVNHCGHLHRIARPVDGPVGTYRGIEVHGGIGRHIGIAVVSSETIAVAFDNYFVRPLVFLVCKAVTAVAVSMGTFKQRSTFLRFIH